MNKRHLFLCGLLLLTAACTDRTTIALLPEADGHVGRIEVQAGGTSQLLDRPFQATRFATDGGKPDAPILLPPEQVEKVWGRALTALPPAPQQFLLYFESGTANLTSDSSALLPVIRDTATTRPFPHLEIAGHADATGSDSLNQTLSRQRADKVAELLRAAGLGSASLAISSHGKRNPLIPTADGVAEPRNRRVSVSVQ